MQIRMTRNHNGYAEGDVLTVDNTKVGKNGYVDSGVADAFVEWARAAVYVQDEKPAFADATAPNKMVQPGDVKRKRGRPPKYPRPDNVVTPAE